VAENIWKVSLAGLDASGVVSIFSLTRVPHFVRRAVPDAPLSAQSRDDLGDAWRYDCAWSFPKALTQTIDRLCTAQGRIDYGTSLWFENIVGHRSLAQEMVFA
jgi:hypothetical protein